MKTIKFENIFIGSTFSFNGIIFRRLEDSLLGEGRVQFLNFPGDPEMNGHSCSFDKNILIKF